MGVGIGIGVDGPAGPAAVAHQLMSALMVGKRCGAMGALGYAAAVLAHEEAGEASAVEQQHRFAFGLVVLFERLGQRR